MPFRVFFSLIVFVGATAELEVVWLFSDIFNGLMALPNLIGLLVLSGLIARETKFYLKHDPKLEADKGQIEAFMAGRPGWEEWKSGDWFLSELWHQAGGYYRLSAQALGDLISEVQTYPAA